MKKITIIATAIMTMFISSNANAEVKEFSPYVGLDYSYTRDNFSFLRTHYNSASINFGADYNKFFGVEAFYQYSDEHTKKIGTAKLKTDMQSYGLDLMGYLPFGCEERFKMIGTVGLGEYRFDGRITGAHGTFREHGYGYRLGTGALYKFSNNISARALVRYIEFDKVSDNDHALEYSMGIRYNF